MSWSDGEIIVPPTAAPISLQDVKEHLRIDGDDEDSALEVFRSAAIDHVSRYTGLALAPQTQRFSSSGWEELRQLPVAPVSSITISYIDENDIEQVLDSSAYRLSGGNSLLPKVVIKNDVVLPLLASVPDAVRITVECGYSAVPPAVRLALLLLTGDWDMNRENSGAQSMNEMPTGVYHLLANWRLFN